jgi:hypothetical protein
MDSVARKQVSHVLLALALIALALDSSRAEEDSRLLFRQDLSTFGYSFHRAKDDGIVYSFTDLAFLSDDLLLLSVREAQMQGALPKVHRGGTLKYDNQMQAQTSADSASTLLLFNVEQKKLVRAEKLPVRKLQGSVQAAGIGRFLILVSNGLQLCSLDFHCGPAWPIEYPFYVSPRGTRIVTGGFQFDGENSKFKFTQQQLLDTSTFSLLQTFPPRRPKIVPGDTGLLLEDSGAKLQMPGQDPFLLDLYGSYMSPEVRFLDDRTVIGIRIAGTNHAKAVAVRVDGKELYDIQMKGESANFFTSVSGTRFGMIEMYSTRLTTALHVLDWEGSPLNRIKVRVFQIASGKQVFETDWGPGDYRGADILPALSPDGHRLALVRKGELQVYELP